MIKKSTEILFYDDIANKLNVNLGSIFQEAMEVPKVKGADENRKIWVDTSCAHSHASALNESLTKIVIFRCNVSIYSTG